MFSETVRLEPLPEGGTRLHDMVQLHFPLPGFLRRILARHIFLRVHKFDRLLTDAARLAGEWYTVASAAG